MSDLIYTNILEGSRWLNTISESQTLNEFLDYFEFEAKLIDDHSFHLVDDTGANWDDIEKDIFTIDIEGIWKEDLLCRIDRYLLDYLEREYTDRLLEDYGFDCYKKFVTTAKYPMYVNPLSFNYDYCEQVFYMYYLISQKIFPEFEIVRNNDLLLLGELPYEDKETIDELLHKNNEKEEWLY